MKPENRINEAAKQLRIAAEELDDPLTYELANEVDALSRDSAEQGAWIRYIQTSSHEWRRETIGEDITPLSQAAHTSVEANEVLDLLVKGETYSHEDGPVGGWQDDEARRKVVEECGDVIVAHLGTLSLLGISVTEAVKLALDKNGARDWESWQEEA